MKKNYWFTLAMESIIVSVVLGFCAYSAYHVYAGVCSYNLVNGECDSQKTDSFGNKKWACSKKVWSTALEKCTASTGDGACDTGNDQCKDCTCKVEGAKSDGSLCYCR